MKEKEICKYSREFRKDPQTGELMAYCEYWEEWTNVSEGYCQGSCSMNSQKKG